MIAIDRSELRTWQTDVDALVAIIESRHATLTTNFNEYLCSQETMNLCARIRRHVLACYEWDGYGLLRARDNYHERNMQCRTRNN